MKSLFHSLRWRLQAWHSLLLLLVIAASSLPGYHLAKENQMQRIDQDLRNLELQLVRSIMHQLTATPEDALPTVVLTKEEFLRRLSEQPISLPTELSLRFQGTDPGHAYFAIRTAQDHTIIQSNNAPADLRFLPPGPDFSEETRTIAERRELAHTTNIGMKVVIGRDITPMLQDMHRAAWVHAGIGFCVWLLSLVGGWWLSGRAIRPIQTISHTASHLAEGNLKERINPTAMDSELAELSRVLNDTFERLHVAFERQRQFTADASHELRTPISILIAETQRLMKRDRTPEEYREGLRTCGETAQRMRKLVDALLVLARQDEQDTKTHHQHCDLASIVREVVVQLTPMANELGRQMNTLLEFTPCRGDPQALAMLASNLISNALQHGGNVIIKTSAKASEVTFSVHDDGPGIPSEHLPHLFDRFYRIDQARTSTSGHSGLGLAIAKAIADNHSATLDVTSANGQGTTFDFHLPI
jgi:heavy metal sensor kinase